MSNVALYSPHLSTPALTSHGGTVPPRPSAGRERHLRIATPVETVPAATRDRISRILVVSPSADTQDALRDVFAQEGCEVLFALTDRGVVDMVERAQVDLVISDVRLPDNGAAFLLQALRDRHPSIQAAWLAPSGITPPVAESPVLGECACLTFPVAPHEASAFLHRLHRPHPRDDQRRVDGVPVGVVAGNPAADARNVAAFHGMYGNTSVMRDIFRTVTRVGRTNVTVLLTGESGTGKELVARALHEESPRRHKPFIALNCSALPSELVESELFGHMRGAFTGAVKERGGLFEAAHGGTLFLDEIGDLGPLAQAKVLRALESGEVMRVGGTRATHVDVRVIAATNRPLDDMVATARFREDLLYRLKVISIALPPLRDRRDDIPLLAEHFLHLFAERHGIPVRTIADDARDLLTVYEWPGNVRELRNVIEGALVLCDGPSVSASDLPRSVTCGALPLTVPPTVIDQVTELSFVEARERALREFDRAFLSAALARNDGNIARTARALGLHRQSLQKLLARRDLKTVNGARSAHR